MAVRSTTSRSSLESFKTNVLSEEKLGLKWYYDP